MPQAFMLKKQFFMYETISYMFKISTVCVYNNCSPYKSGECGKKDVLSFGDR
jgi:hypothetical protein